MSRTAAALTIAGLAVCGNVTPSAQSKSRLAFEVASVRAFTLDSGFRNLHRTTETRVDRIRFMGMLLMEAFRQPNLHRIFAPDWVNQVMVEIQATTPRGTTAQQVPEMLHTLLEERFGLVTHREARPTDAYELTVASGGMKMREVEPLNELDKELPADPSTGFPQREVFTRETPDGTVRMFQVSGGGFTRMTSRTLYERRTVHNEGSIITATRMTMAELVTELEIDVDRPVVDKTGLPGVYQFTIQLPIDEPWERALRLSAAQRGSTSVAGTEPRSGLTVFKSLETLGLKLERRRVLVDVIVVDKISRTPTEN